MDRFRFQIQTQVFLNSLYCNHQCTSNEPHVQQSSLLPMIDWAYFSFLPYMQASWALEWCWQFYASVDIALENTVASLMITINPIRQGLLWLLLIIHSHHHVRINNCNDNWNDRFIHNLVSANVSTTKCNKWKSRLNRPRIQSCDTEIAAQNCHNKKTYLPNIRVRCRPAITAA